MLLLARMSISNVHGPENMRRCSVPSVPAPGLEKTWPVNAGRAGRG